MKQLSLLFTLLFFSLVSCVCSSSFAAENQAETSPIQVGVIYDSQDVTRITLTVDDFTSESIEVNDNSFDQFAIGTEPTLFREGWPNLPFISRVVLVPPQSDITLVIHSINSRIETGWEPTIAPRELNGDVEFVEASEEFLSVPGFWPPEPIKLSEPAILRGNRLVTVIMYPFQYNAQTGEMRFNDSFDFELAYEGNNGVNPVINPERDRPSSNMGRILDGLVVNPPQRDFANPDRGSYLMIYPNVNGVLAALQPLIDWRKRSGWDVHLQEVANNAGTGTVKPHIQRAYDNWDNPPEMVALVGDADGAIGIAAYNQTDHDYVMLDGNDILADADIGRLSVSTTAELARVVAKIVNYESNPYMQNTGWFREGMVCAGSQTSGLSTILVNRWVKYELEARGFNDIHEWYFNAPFQGQSVPQFFQNEFQRGVSFSNYRGWVGIENLSPNQIMNFNRHQRYPTVILLTCSSGNYIGTFGHTEAFFRSEGGGTGAVGLCTNNTHVQFNNAVSTGTWVAFLKEKIYTFGTAVNRGRIELWRQYAGFDDGSVNNFCRWTNLMGDPATHIYTGVPEILIAEHPESFSTGESYFRIEVLTEDGEEPVKDAVVCLHKADDDFQVLEYTDADGIVNFHINSDALSEGDLLVTVTKHNTKAILATVLVEDSEFYIGLETWRVDDDEEGESVGDGDETANPGEVIELQLGWTNFGSEVPEGGATVMLESVSPRAEVVGEPLETENCPQVGESDEGIFVVNIDPACPDQYSLQFVAQITAAGQTWTSMVEVNVESPKIAITDLDFAGGELEPGEVKLLDVTLRNVGNKNLDLFVATLVSHHSVVTVVDEEVQYNAIAEGRSGTGNNRSFRVRAHPFTVPGTVVELMVYIESEAGFRDTTTITFELGQPDVTDPFGPDDYGYVCFDDGDRDWEMAPVYDWIEIDPNEDEDFRGTNTDLRDGGDNQDQSMVVDLPFPFMYYGEEFNQLTICTNGWAAFGNWEDLSDFRNRRIASGGGPNAQLCVFWDNMITGRIFYHYDADGAQFIVEWNDMRRIADQVNETFELILYDPEFHPTYSGDGAIVYQYKEVRNSAAPGRNDTPYCTIGIGNLDDTDGLEYTYWNTYARGAKHLENEMAIKFTTASEFITGTIEGTVTDVETGAPLPDVTLLTTRGFWAETDEAGHYVVEDIIIGEDYSITASKQGWNDSTLTGFDIAEDETLHVDFALLHPEFTPSVEDMARALNIDGNTQVEFEVTNTGNGPLEWRVEKHLRGDANAAPWELREQIPAGAITGDSRIQGVVYVNDLFYAAGSNDRDPVIYVINREGELIEQFAQPGGGGGYGFKDMAFDGEWIWGSGSATIWAINLQGEVMAEFAGPFNPTNNLTWDRDREILWVSSTTSNIIGIDREGNEVAEFNRQEMRIYGLAYWPDSPDGYSIYVYHKNTDIGNNLLSKMNPDNGDVEFVGILMPEGGGDPIAAFITNQYDVYSWVLIAVVNRGAEDRFDIWQVDARKDWFSVDPEVGVIETEEVQGYTLTLDATELPPVLFEGDLVYYHNALGGETRIGVSLQVNGGPGQRAQRVLNFQPGWNMVSLNIVPDNNDILEITRPLVDENLLTLMKDGIGRFYLVEREFNNIPGWAVTDGYMMYVRGDAALQVSGRTVAPDQPIPLAEGWNMKSYFPNEPIDAIAALELIADQLIIAKDVLGQFYFPEFGFSNMGNMIPGSGYQFKVQEDIELVYNAENRLAAESNFAETPNYFIAPVSSGKNSSILALAPEEFAGWEIGVFTSDDILIGSGVINSAGEAGIAVWEDNHFTDVTDGAVEGDNLRFRVWNGNSELNSGIDPIIGELVWSPDGLLVGNLFIDPVIPVEFGIHNAYPNPFNSQVRLSYGLSDNGDVTMQIFDMAGRLVSTLAKGSYQAGIHHLVWDASQATSGLYFARLENAGKTATVKLMLVK